MCGMFRALEVFLFYFNEDISRYQIGVDADGKAGERLRKLSDERPGLEMKSTDHLQLHSRNFMTTMTSKESAPCLRF